MWVKMTYKLWNTFLLKNNCKFIPIYSKQNYKTKIHDIYAHSEWEALMSTSKWKYVTENFNHNMLWTCISLNTAGTLERMLSDFLNVKIAQGLLGFCINSICTEKNILKDSFTNVRCVHLISHNIVIGIS
jgi:hypothetical protein